MGGLTIVRTVVLRLGDGAKDTAGGKAPAPLMGFCSLDGPAVTLLVNEEARSTTLLEDTLGVQGMVSVSAMSLTKPGAGSELFSRDRALDISKSSAQSGGLRLASSRSTSSLRLISICLLQPNLSSPMPSRSPSVRVSSTGPLIAWVFRTEITSLGSGEQSSH